MLKHELQYRIIEILHIAIYIASSTELLLLEVGLGQNYDCKPTKL